MMNKNWFKEVNSKIDDYNIINLCEAMQVAYHKISAEIYLLNLRDCLGWLVRDKGYKLVRWTHKDIDFNKINVIPDNHHAKGLRAPMGFISVSIITGWLRLHGFFIRADSIIPVRTVLMSRTIQKPLSML